MVGEAGSPGWNSIALFSIPVHIKHCIKMCLRGSSNGGLLVIIEFHK